MNINNIIQYIILLFFLVLVLTLQFYGYYNKIYYIPSCTEPTMIQTNKEGFNSFILERNMKIIKGDYNGSGTLRISYQQISEREHDKK